MCVTKQNLCIIFIPIDWNYYFKFKFSTLNKCLKSKYLNRAKLLISYRKVRKTFWLLSTFYLHHFPFIMCFEDYVINASCFNNFQEFIKKFMQKFTEIFTIWWYTFSFKIKRCIDGKAWLLLRKHDMLFIKFHLNLVIW